MRACLLVTALCGFLAAPGLVGSAEPVKDDGRVVTAISNANAFLEDAEYLVVTLAGDEKAWIDVVEPNIRVWLPGVDPALPFGLDIIFDSDVGRRVQMNVPIESARSFREDNLNPIDITTRPVPQKKNLYQLGGVQEGFLRFIEIPGKPMYAVTSKVQAEVWPNIDSPQDKLTKTLEGGYDAAILWNASPESREKREKAFDKMKQNLLEAVKKRPDESTAAFELRQLVVEQQSTRLSRLLTNTAHLKAGWITDAKARKFGGNSRMEGLPETPLAKDIERIGSEKSRFAKLPTAENAILTTRLLMPVNEQTQKEQTELYKKWLAAWNERIDEKKESSAEEKAARKDLAERVVKMLTDGLALGWIDNFTQVTPDDGGLATGVLGIRVQDSSEVPEILNTLQRIQPAWKAELNTSEEQGIKIHKLDLKAKLPKSLQEFFGDSGLFFVGTGEQVLWVAGGPNAQSQLSAAINAAAAADAEEVGNDPAQINMKMHLVLKFLHAFFQDKDIDLFRSINQSRILPGEEEGGKKKKHGSDRKVTKDVLKNFKWQETAIKALEAGNDGLELRIHKDGNALLGELKLQEGVMKAIGTVVTKFANEVLK